MSMSLREQLLAAGLVSKKQAKQANREQHQQRKNPGQRPDQSRAAQQAAAKLARDQELNRKHREKAERKARTAAIRQLIEQNRIPRIESDEYFNFIDGKKIHRIAVNAETRARIQSGALAVVRYIGFHALVPAETAAKIREHDEQAVVKLDLKQDTVSEDDPYKDHQVPDDLMW